MCIFGLFWGGQPILYRFLSLSRLQLGSTYVMYGGYARGPTRFTPRLFSGNLKRTTSIFRVRFA